MTIVLNHKLRVVLSVIITFCLLLAMAGNAKAAANIRLFVEGTEIIPDAKPYINNGRTFVPVRFATEPIGATLDWRGGSEQTAVITKDDKRVEIKIGAKTANIDGVAYKLEAPAEIRSNRTFVPLRFIAEAFGANVEWRESTKSIYITEGDGQTSDNLVPAHRPFQYLGYYYYGQPSLNDLTAFKNELTGTIHFGYRLQEDGSIAEKDNFNNDLFNSAGGGHQVAKDAGQDVYMLVTGFSKSALTSVLSDSAKRQKAINDIYSIMQTRNLDGIDLDFESVDASQRQNLVTFTKELRAKIGNSKRLTLSSMPRSADSQYWLDGYDYKGLSQYADYLILMCYNEHYSGGTPGPVASASWTEKVIKYTLNQGVPKDKIIVALGSYGYDWPSGAKGSSLSNTAARSKAAQFGATIYRDKSSGCLFYNYTDTAGKGHQVWFEDSVSLGQKAALAKKYDLGGLAFWRLGFYTNEIWSSILTKTNHANAYTWQQKAQSEPEIPVKDGDNVEEGTDIENNEDFVPQS